MGVVYFSLPSADGVRLGLMVMDGSAGGIGDEVDGIIHAKYSAMGTWN